MNKIQSSSRLKFLFFLFFSLLILTTISFNTISYNKNTGISGTKSRNKTEPELSFNKKEVKTNSLKMNFIKINPGSFYMGSNQGEYDEKPIHRVAIFSPFSISTTPVTNSQYEQFDLNHKLLQGKRTISCHDNEAVLFVSWHDAVAFTKWLSQKEGKPYRLPTTETEWKYACRAGTITLFNTGDSLPVIYHLNQKIEWYPKPVILAVGKSPANQWGLFNMHGLDEEWCLDWYGPYIDKVQTDPEKFIIRYADVLLMYAEASIELGQI